MQLCPAVAQLDGVMDEERDDYYIVNKKRVECKRKCILDPLNPNSRKTCALTTVDRKNGITVIAGHAFRKYYTCNAARSIWALRLAFWCKYVPKIL